MELLHIRKMACLGWMVWLCFGYSVKGWAQLDSVAHRFVKIQSVAEDSLRLRYASGIIDFLKRLPFGACDREEPVKYLRYRLCVNAQAEMYSWAVPLSRGQVFFNWFHFQEGDRWYGTDAFSEEGETPLFYDWLAFPWQDGTGYMALGWYPTRRTNRKVVRVLSFGANGKVEAGPPCIRKGEKRVSALTFEYAREASMLLRQDRPGKRIVFDHLSPNEPEYEGCAMLYGPDGSFGALIWTGKEWEYVEHWK